MIICLVSGEKHPWFAELLFIFSIASVPDPLVCIRWLDTRKKNGEVWKDEDLDLYIVHTNNPYLDVQPLGSVVGRVFLVKMKRDHLGESFWVVE